MNFPPQILNFAAFFVAMQTKRHRADYDPDEMCYMSDVQADIFGAESVIKGLSAAPLKDKRAFAALVLLKDRNA